MIHAVSLSLGNKRYEEEMLGDQKMYFVLLKNVFSIDFLRKVRGDTTVQRKLQERLKSVGNTRTL